MSLTSSDEECDYKVIDGTDRKRTQNFLWMRGKSRNRRKRRRRPTFETDEDELYRFLRRLRPKKCRMDDGRVVTSFYDPVERKTYCESSPSGVLAIGDTPPRDSNATDPTPVDNTRGSDGICHVDKLPEEILLLIFSYLPLAMLLLVIPHVCNKWEKLAMDWTLWKAVEHLRIKSMVVTTSEVKTLLRTIPKLKKLELVMRNDTEELLDELFLASDHLEVLRLDRCRRSGLPLNIPSSSVKSILELCPKLKSVTLTDTHFRSRDFYKSLARRFTAFDRINISCTTKSEMKLFMDHLKNHVPGVEFQSVSMMGKADGKQIYWGPILGLVIRPNPTSPYHRHHNTSEFPNYAF